MSFPFWKKIALVSLASAFVVASLSFSVGQDTKKGSGKAKTEVKETAKAKGRLPAYFKDVVTEEQKDQIYTIQAKYEKQISDLQSQLEEVRSQQMAEIEKLLSADQKKKLADLRAEADAKKKSAKKAR